MPDVSKRQTDSQSEITPQMVAAGARTLSALGLCHDGSARSIAKTVFDEMLAASPYSLVAKSTTSS